MTKWVPDTAGARLGSRALFPALEARAYLNHAAISPPSSEVRRGLEAWLSDWERRGLSALGDWLAQRERLRGRLARLIGAPEDRVALLASTTTSVVSVAHCFDWRAGDRVVCLTGEFPTNVTPWQRAADTFELEVVYLEAEAFRTDRGLDEIERVLAQGARMIAVSAVQFQTGLRMPIREIADLAHRSGARVFVDAIQACGVVPIDVDAAGIDFLGCGSHKWLMGTEGAGFLYARHGADLVPRLAGWLSHEDPIRFLFEGAGHLRYDRPLKEGPAFLESGAANSAGFVALEAAVAQLEAIGVDAIYQHVQRFHDAVEPRFAERGFVSERSERADGRSGILSFTPPEGLAPAALVAALAERGVAISGPDGRVRVAPHWPNALDEVDFIVEQLDAVLAAR